MLFCKEIFFNFLVKAFIPSTRLPFHFSFSSWTCCDPSIFLYLLISPVFRRTKLSFALANWCILCMSFFSRYSFIQLFVIFFVCHVQLLFAEFIPLIYGFSLVLWSWPVSAFKSSLLITAFLELYLLFHQSFCFPLFLTSSPLYCFHFLVTS